MLKKIKVIFAVSVFMYNGNYTFSQEINSEKVNYNLAITNIQNGNYQVAVNYLLKVIKLNPINTQAHYNLGVCYKKLGDSDKATEEFNQSFSISDNKIKTEQEKIAYNSYKQSNEPKMSMQENDYIQMAELYSESKETDKAIDYLNKVIELNPLNSKAYYLLAKCYNTTENHEKARTNIISALNIVPGSKVFLEFQQEVENKDVSQSIIIDEKRTVSFIENQNITIDSEYYNKKGIEYIKYNEYEKAELYFNKSIELNKNNYQSYNNLALLSIKNNQYDNAIKFANNALLINPELSEALYNIAIAYKKKNNNNKAINYLNKTIVLSPQNEKCYYLKALIYLDLKDTKKAKESLLKTLKIKNDHYDANFNLAIIYANEGNLNDAILYMTEASKNQSDNGKNYYYLGLLYESINNTNLANNAYQNSVDKNYSDKNLFINYANSMLETKNYEKALNIVESGLKYNSESHELYNLKGMILINMKNLNEAKKAFKKALDYNEKRPIYHYNLSQCYLLLEKQNLASDEFQKAVELKPIYPQDYLDLTAILTDRGMNENAISIAKEGLKAFPNENRLNIVLVGILEDKALLKETKSTLKKYNKNDIAQPIKKHLEEKLEYLNSF